MPAVRDPDVVLVEELLAPPPVEDARSSFEFWVARRQALPVYRRAARREAAELADRWRERLRAAEQARFDASRPGRLLATLGLSRFWPTRPAVDKSALLAFSWMLVPRQLKLYVVGAAAILFVVLALTLAALVLALGQLRLGALKRLLPTVIVLVLLGGTVAAFAFTERLKLDKSPISGMRKVAEFSPDCNCPTARARIAFKLAKADQMTLSIVDSARRTVRTLVNDHRTEGFNHYTWNGRDNDGRLVLDGTYALRIQLGDLDRTFFPPNPIKVDTTPPKVHVTPGLPKVFSPDGDKRADKVTVAYRLDEPGRAFLLVNGRRRVTARVRLAGGDLQWFGLLNGRPVRTGTYRLEVMARDRAGNVSRPVPAGKVHVRYIKLVEDVIHVTAGHRAKVYVSTDATSYHWQVGRHLGAARKRLLRLPLLKKGRYVLYVQANDHLDRAYVVVTRRR